MDICEGKEIPLEKSNEEKFLRALRDLFHRYGVSIKRHSNYDKEENYCGDSYSFCSVKYGFEFYVECLEDDLRGVK